MSGVCCQLLCADPNCQSFLRFLSRDHRITPASVLTSPALTVCSVGCSAHQLAFTCHGLLRLAWAVDCSARPTRAAASTHSPPGTRNKPHSVYDHAGLRSTASRGGRYDVDAFNPWTLLNPVQGGVEDVNGRRSTSSTPATQRCCGCGKSDSAAIGRRDIDWLLRRSPGEACLSVWAFPRSARSNTLSVHQLTISHRATALEINRLGQSMPD